ncbi:4'-phosphopantetheinyl transferase family protein [Paenibacillus sp. GCM10012307]|uniref:4'-phosphopantetheinyl transferase superfamily protein n=1 Tax=Paenibacillus roseus TaxID=2798579 RepID=A0A934JBN0_9BACL|nr:4'-phosphopantetheinyl transferase superfamily protein [Paenibacillus roseus]MBJ6364087.1 4'-phosphopantetheinyl transferase superfamily protein [Paenibacillus roseus]
MIEVYMLQLDEKKAAALYPTLLNYVSAERREAVRRFRKSADAYRSLTGEMMVRLAACRRWQVRNNELSFSRNEFGKPLLDKPSGCYFNVSHAGDWVVCAFGDCPVGIDVERIKLIDISVAEWFCVEEEYDALMGLPASRQLTYFYRLWTLKESYIKAVGKGLSIPLDSFSFAIGEDGEVTAHLGAEAAPAYFRQYVVDESHVMTLCTFRDAVPTMRQLEYGELEGLLPLLG